MDAGSWAFAREGGHAVMGLGILQRAHEAGLAVWDLTIERFN
jgi:hypothetical protein